MPSPNAHDLYLAAARSIHLTPVDEVLDGGNTGTNKAAKTYPLTAKVNWLRENRRGFQLFKTAQEAEYLFPPIRTPLERGEIPIPYELRNLAKFKAVESHVFGEKGQSEQAIESALDIWKLGIDAAQGAPLTPALNALAIETHARKALSPEIAHLDSGQATNAARRLENILAQRVSYREILQEERNTTLHQQKPLYEKAMHEANQAKAMEASIARGDYSFSSSYGPIPKLRGPLVNYQMRQIASKYNRGISVLIEHADLSWPKRASQSFPFQPDTKTTALLRTIARSRFFYTRADAASQLSLARLGLHAFRKQTGSYPAALNALVPNYLKAMPRDPFSEGQPLRYRRDGKRYTLWSIGPDAQDNDGHPAENPASRTPEGRYLLSPESTGDMVANIND